MEIWEAVVLGLIQGLTEFLPVSSSGHLEIANYLFGIEEPNNLSFTVALHAGTVFSTILVFRKDIAALLAGFFKFRMNDQMVYVINILVSLVPILFVGLFFKDSIESLFTSNMLLVGCMLIVTAALLAFAQRSGDRGLPITPKRAFIIGLAQACAVLPGLSRSGSTIAAGLIQGVKRDEVARFSFLMVLVPIIGMSVLEFGSADGGQAVEWTNIIAGFVTSFVVGLLACKWMVRLVSRGRLKWFAVYCLAMGVAAIAMNFIG